MLGNQDKGHDELTAFGVRVTDQSFIVLVCELKFTVSHEVSRSNQGECLVLCLFISTCTSSVEAVRVREKICR